MKKILALALAFVMTMGLASVAFAADGEFRFEVRDDVNHGSGKDVYRLMDGNTVYVENADGDLVLTTDPSAGTVEEGDSLYIKLNVVNEMTAKEAGRWKVKADWRVGADLVDSVSVVYKRFGATAADYSYFVEIKTNEKATTKMNDLLGILSLYETSPSSAKAEDNRKVLFAVEENNYATYGYASVHLVNDKNGSVYNLNHEESEPVYSFSNLDEEVITFEGVGEYEINLYQQGKLYLGFSTEFDAEVSEKFPEAELEFVKFPGKPAFNKWGVFYLYADEDNKFVYEMKDGVISKVDATWDASMDAYRFAAKRFDTFIISDVELDLSAVNTPAEDETPKDNPATGR